MELNQIRRVGVSRKGAEPRPLTLDLPSEMIELIQAMLEVLGKMESGQRGLERAAAGLDAVGESVERWPGNHH